jgi:hypothetical protein
METEEYNNNYHNNPRVSHQASHFILPLPCQVPLLPSWFERDGHMRVEHDELDQAPSYYKSST